MICSKGLYTVQALGPTFKGHFSQMSDIQGLAAEALHSFNEHCSMICVYDVFCAFLLHYIYINLENSNLRLGWFVLCCMLVL